MPTSYEALSVVFVDDLSSILIKPQCQPSPLAGHIIHLAFCLLQHVVCQICEVLNIYFFKVKSSFLFRFQPVTCPPTTLFGVPSSQLPNAINFSTSDTLTPVCGSLQQT
jgi:hypothetical protein